VPFVAGGVAAVCAGAGVAGAGAAGLLAVEGFAGALGLFSSLWPLQPARAKPRQAAVKASVVRFMRFSPDVTWKFSRRAKWICNRASPDQLHLMTITSLTLIPLYARFCGVIVKVLFQKPNKT
jgi:hypothetical protein